MVVQGVGCDCIIQYTVRFITAGDTPEVRKAIQNIFTNIVLKI